MIHFDPVYYLFAAPGLLLAIYAKIKLSSTYAHYRQIPNERGLTGAQAAREILDQAGLPGMEINLVNGELSDHYDPTKKALFLSEESYHGRSLASVGVAAHEAGHALQHKAAYGMFKFRMTLVPVTQIASSSAYLMFLAGMFFMHSALLINIAIGLFATVALFQIVTLPVEFDASSRAKEQLFRLGLVRADERRGISKVLNAAAMTYVAAMLTAVLELLYFLHRARSRD